MLNLLCILKWIFNGIFFHGLTFCQKKNHTFKLNHILTTHISPCKKKIFLQPQAQAHQSGQQHNQSQQNNQQQIQTNQQQQQTYTIPGTNIQIPASANGLINAANLQNIKVEGAGKWMHEFHGTLTLSHTANHLCSFT